ncbi:class I SAM-dependent methyltransferase [Nocardioides xinjiangensis]|uniref:class I SAM-dependent methyltransferase n=1 Tax=Nocardioides xinjiangensis TaxID=2817376 RepID=UPI001B3019E9|nr:class I SAM-dependent methyltransferase [Nocardioides sp. SYSU D00778]
MRSLSQLRRPGALEVLRIDAQEIVVSPSRERLVDVAFDGRRIWSFWLLRDGQARDDGIHLSWPKPLRPFLDGVTEVTMTDPGTGTVLYSRTVRLGDRRDRIEVVNAAGRPLSLDKSLKLVETFDTRDAAQVEPLLDAIDEVLGALRKAGLDAFLAYGTALGAVRDGGLIGHDSDADLGYVSTYDHPVDVIRESFRVQRALTDMGYRVTRYSAIALKVHVLESDGLDRGLDVFGGFMRNGVLYLMGEIAVPFRREWIHPLGTASLEGREFPVPADADKFLTATYGPHWRVPDPAYKFTTPASTIELFNGWFRGMRTGRAGWHGYHKRTIHQEPTVSDVAREVAERHPDLATYVDIGCGRGADVGFFADRGVAAVGLDFQPYAYEVEAQRRADDPRVTFQLFNLLELRHVLAVPAWLARLPGPRAVGCVHVVERLGRRGRLNMLRASRMVLAGTTGTLHLQFLSEKGRDGYARRTGARKALDPAVVLAEVAESGGRVLEDRRTRVSADPASSQVCRLIIDWNG